MVVVAISDRTRRRPTIPSTTAPTENQSHSEVEQAALNNQCQGLGLPPGKPVSKPQINSHSRSISTK